MRIKVSKRQVVVSTNANMPTFKIALFGLLFISALASGSKCPPDNISKLVVCYYKSETSLIKFNVCNCTHIIFTSGVKTENNTITATEDSISYIKTLKERKANLSAIFTLEVEQNDVGIILKSENRSSDLINKIFSFLENSSFDGIELNFKFNSDDGVSKESYATFVKALSKTLSSTHLRIKRESYDVFEKLQDDITTAAYTTQAPKNSTSKTQSIKRRNRKRLDNSRKIRENLKNEKEANVLTLEAINDELSGKKSDKSNSLKNAEEEKKFLIFIRLSIQPETIAKKFDLKAFSRYADYLIVPSHDIVNDDEQLMTYHPSRLMGLTDILNTDSILDLLTGMGALKSKLVISLPATVLKFQLKNKNKNTPRSPSLSKPQIIDQSQLCSLFAKNNWTVERDDDLTAPYAFSGNTWLAFEDEISVNIKGKYILLRELAGGAIYSIDADLNDGSCKNHTGSGGYLTGILHKNFESLERKPRALILETLQEEIHDTAYSNIEDGIKVSEYRIVRVVDHSGAVHVIRKNTKTQFECSRQGYFSHPLGCNKFYRCVKFDQYSDEFTVFEYNCPAGLAFDERWEVCVWPGSLPHGAPCTGSSEIAPVPRSHYQCPNHEGYFAHPENCRWFFACLDHARDGITPLTAYEFRCPFGLVFSEQKLTCDWPWLVGSCGAQGARIHLATFINGGNLETSFGQFTNQDASFIGFGKKFGSVLKPQATYLAQGSYEGAQSAGLEYIASRFDSNHGGESFAAFPDYEISGGRIFNTGGVVLNQNVAGISGSTTGHIKEGLSQLNERKSQRVGASKSLNEKAAHIHQGVVSFADDNQSLSKFQHFKPILETSKTSEISSQGHLLYQQHEQNVLSTPTPISVSIPSGVRSDVKIFNQQSAYEPKAQLYGKQYSITHGLPSNQPDVSVTVPVSVPVSVPISVPVVTSKPEIFTLEKLKSSSHLKAESPFGSFHSTSKPEFYNFEQFKNQGKLSGTILSNHPPYSIERVELSDGSLGTQTVNTLASVSTVTSKPAVQSTKFAASNLDTEINQSSLSKGSFNQENFKIVDQNNGNNVFVGISQEIPTAQVNVFKNTNEGQSLVSKNIGNDLPEVSPVAVTPSIFVTASRTEATPGISPQVSLSPDVIQLTHSSIDQKISNELRLLKPQNSFGSSTTTAPAVPKTIFSEHSNKPPAEVLVITPKPGFNILSQKGSHSQSVTEKNKIEVTPQPNIFNYYGNSGAASFDYLGVTPVIDNSGALKTYTKQYSNVSPAVPGANFHSVEEASFLKQKETATGKYYSIPAVASDIRTGSIVQEASHPLVTPKPENKISFIVSPPKLTFNQGSSYSSSIQQLGNSFDSVKTHSTVPDTIKKTSVFPPKVEQSNILTVFSIEKQPIVSIGSISSTNIDHSLDTSKFLSQNVLPKSFRVNEFKSVSSQPEYIAVTTQAPVAPIIPPSQISTEKTPDSGAYYTPKSLQPTSLKQLYDANVETVSSSHQQTLYHLQENTVFGQKSNTRPYLPVSYVTSAPPTYEKETIQRINDESFFDKSSGYFPVVTPKTEIFGSTIQENAQVSAAQFGKTERNPILIHNEQIKPEINHQFDFIKTKSSTEEKRPQYNQQQILLPSSTPLQEPQQRVLTEQHSSTVISPIKPFKGQEEQSGVEISKSIELNPSQLYQINNENVSPSRSLPPLVIEQQPLHLLSHKTFPVKQVIQPFFKQAEKDNVNKFEKPYEFPQLVGVEAEKDILQKKQQLAPPAAFQPKFTTVSFSTAKTIYFNQPNVYSVEKNRIVPPLPVFETSQSPHASPVDTTISSIETIVYAKDSGKTLLVESNVKPQPYNVFSPKVNLLLPTTTEIPQPTQLQFDEFSVQSHTNFDSQRINTFSSTPATNVFIQPKTYLNSKPDIKTFETPTRVFQYNKIQNLTAGSSSLRSDSKGKHAFNPSIKIHEPPREYISTLEGLSTPLSRKTTGQFQSTSTESVRSGFTGSIYLSPSDRNKNSKVNFISSVNLPEVEVGGVNIKQAFDKNTEKFDQVVNVENERFIATVNNGNADESKIIKETQFKVSDTTPRQRSRGRQYYGGITSGLKATTKYEGYEIDGNKGSQRGFNFKENGQNLDNSKTSIDLKNLKVDKNKKTVIIVSQVSDANPVLIGKLAGQCSCQSNMIELRSKNKKTKSSSRERNNSQDQQQRPVIFNEFLPPFESNHPNVDLQVVTQSEASTAAPNTVIIGGSKGDSKDKFSYPTEKNLVLSSTTNQPVLASSTLLSSLGPDGVLSITPKAVGIEEKPKRKQFRGRTRYFSSLPSNGSPAPLLSAVPASEIADTYDFSVLKEDESRIQNEINGGSADGISKSLAGAAFDRYGPGGWRGFDETLQGSVDCKRPGLFRHPKYCNKFYACNYDPWKERYTLHVFNCPIHLTYDSSISACNWPVRGPACADDNLLV